MTAAGNDESILLALFRYLDAAPRVAGDFARRGSVVRDLVVELTDQDDLRLRYRRGPSPLWRTLPFPVPDPESAVAALADLLQEEEFDEGDTSWPGCLPGHPHPPAPAVAAGRAAWTCPRSGEAISVIP